MRYCSLEIITTGLDPLKNDILEIGMIIEDTIMKLPYEKIPKLRFWIDREHYRGNPYALVSNQEVFKQICKLRDENSKRLIQPDDVFTKIGSFLKPYFAVNNIFAPNSIVIAGRNFGSLTRLFLSRLKSFEGIPFSPRVLDPSVICMDWENDSIPPSLTVCKERLGIRNTKQDTLSFAWDIIEVLRSKY